MVYAKHRKECGISKKGHSALLSRPRHSHAGDFEICVSAGVSFLKLGPVSPVTVSAETLKLSELNKSQNRPFGLNRADALASCLTSFWFPVSVNGDFEDYLRFFPVPLASLPPDVILLIFFSNAFTSSHLFSVLLLPPESRSPQAGCKQTSPSTFHFHVKLKTPSGNRQDLLWSGPHSPSGLIPHQFPHSLRTTLFTLTCGHTSPSLLDSLTTSSRKAPTPSMGRVAGPYLC